MQFDYLQIATTVIIKLCVFHPTVNHMIHRTESKLLFLLCFKSSEIEYSLNKIVNLLKVSMTNEIDF